MIYLHLSVDFLNIWSRNQNCVLINKHNHIIINAAKNKRYHCNTEGYIYLHLGLMGQLTNVLFVCEKVLNPREWINKLIN